MMGNQENQDGQYDYQKLLGRREWKDKRIEMIEKSPRCQKCGRSGRRFALHHRWYDYGRLPWAYPDEAYMIVCVGNCHREADEDREEEDENAKISKLYGWQGELGRGYKRPNRRGLQKLAEYEANFRTWLIQNEIIHSEWNWEVYPLWYLWNQLSVEYLSSLPKHPEQLSLDV